MVLCTKIWMGRTPAHDTHTQDIMWQEGGSRRRATHRQIDQGPGDSDGHGHQVGEAAARRWLRVAHEPTKPRSARRWRTGCGPEPALGIEPSASGTFFLNSAGLLEIPGLTKKLHIASRSERKSRRAKSGIASPAFTGKPPTFSIILQSLRLLNVSVTRVITMNPPTYSRRTASGVAPRAARVRRRYR